MFFVIKKEKIPIVFRASVAGRGGCAVRAGRHTLRLFKKHRENFTRHPVALSAGERYITVTNRI